MPALNILTNLPKAKIPKDFVDKIIPTLSKVVNKPEQKFICVVSSDALLHMHGDSVSPGAVARLESIGNLGPEQNQVIMRHLADFVEKELGISPNSDALLHMHGDSVSPGAVTCLDGIGNLGTEQNQVIISHLANFIEKERGISLTAKFFLTFYDLEKHNVGTKGTTVAQLE